MEPPTYEYPKPTLLDLSDYSLLHIFSYLNSTSLFQLSRTCKRIDELVNEKKLWIRIDARDQPINTYKVDFCLERINSRTSSLYFAANCRSEQILPNTFLHENICSNLRILALENQMILGDLLSLSDYPPSLTEISFRKSFIVNYQSFFRYSNKTMKNLKVLVLDECGWVESDMVMPFSKYPKLEVLSLYMCKKLSYDAISYLSIAACSGFKNLRILDVRFTGLGDQVLKAFYKHKTLQELYSNYASTYDRAMSIFFKTAYFKDIKMSNVEDIKLQSPSTIKWVRNKLQELFGTDSETEEGESLPTTPGKFLKAMLRPSIVMTGKDVEDCIAGMITPIVNKATKNDKTQMVKCSIQWHQIVEELTETVCEMSKRTTEPQAILTWITLPNNNRMAPTFIEHRTGDVNIITQQLVDGNVAPYKGKRPRKRQSKHCNISRKMND